MTRIEFEAQALELRTKLLNEVAQLDRSSHRVAIDQLERRIALLNQLDIQSPMPIGAYSSALISDRGGADGQDLDKAKSSDS